MFELLAERVCMECVNGNEMCECGGYDCPFWGDFERLEKLCNEAEELASSLSKSVSRDYYADMEEAYQAERY